MAETYYSRLSVDPDWRTKKNATARRWYKRLRETDPARFRKLRKAKTERDRRRRAKFTPEERAAVRAADVERKRRRRALAGRGLTFQELRERVPDFGERTSLRIILEDEVRSGRVP